MARSRLTDDGAIFVSIDDNEVHHLRALMDEVFGEENFVAKIIIDDLNPTFHECRVDNNESGIEKANCVQ